MSYSTAKLTDISGRELLTSARQSVADEFRTGILWNDRGALVLKPLPIEAQTAPAYAIEAIDVAKDGKKEVGNMDRTRERLGKMDAKKDRYF